MCSMSSDAFGAHRKSQGTDVSMMLEGDGGTFSRLYLLQLFI
jgi:hypothetical protein